MKVHLPLILALCMLTACVSTNKSIPVADGFAVERIEMKVGDTWVGKSLATGETTTSQVIEVLPDGGWIEEAKTDKGDWWKYYYNAEHQLTRKVDMKTGEDDFVYDPPAMRIKFPLHVGLSWSDSYVGHTNSGGISRYTNTYRVVDYVEIEVRGTTYQAFFIHQMNKNQTARSAEPAKRYYCPATKSLVKYSPSWMRGWELVSFTPGPE